MLKRMALNYVLATHFPEDIILAALHHARFEEAKAQARRVVMQAHEAAHGHVDNARYSPPVLAPEAASALVSSAHQSLAPLGR